MTELKNEVEIVPLDKIILYTNNPKEYFVFGRKSGGNIKDSKASEGNK